MELSVVIPSFNHEAFVGPAIESALADGRADLEVIVVDDGSTDGSRERLSAYEADPRVRLHHQENRGAHAALNRGCELARGRLIFILNSDDVFDPRRLEVLTGRLDNNPDAVLAASWIEIIDGENARLGVKQAWKTLPPWPAATTGPFLSAGGDPRLALLETNWLSTTSNMAFPAALIHRHKLSFAPLRYTHDWDFALSACHLGAIELVEEPLLRYRVHGANTIDQGTDQDRGLMRFEILWVVARHAMRLIRSSASSETGVAHLRALLSTSAPSFACDAVFDQLLLVRGADDEPPQAFEALLDPGHPFRTAAIEVLQG